MEILEGVVTGVTYQNPENGFMVLRLERTGDSRMFTCVGVLPSIQSGESVRLLGEWESHKRFGPQFNVKSYESIKPTTVDGIISLLSSGFVSNVGKVRARLMVDTFGLETLDVLDNNPNRLSEVSGIGPKTAAKITDAWQKQKHLRSLMLYLAEFGITLNLSYKIYKAYGAEARRVIDENPYRMVEDIWGVGFKRADAIAQRTGIPHDSYQRIRAGIAFVLQEATGDGHCYLPRNLLCEEASSILDVPAENIVFTLDHVTADRLVIAEEERVYLPSTYYAEKSVAELLKRRLEKSAESLSSHDAEVKQWLAGYIGKSGWNGDPKQVEAVHAAAKSRVLLLTGGPGTGKTTTLQVIVSYFRDHNRSVALCAPTGRAAQRMGSIAGISAKTIHRLLEYHPSEGELRFGRNLENQLEVDALVVDEVSMIDIQLMRSLLEALPFAACLILVGDDNQLPSVGAGNVLADLISSSAVPHVHLTTIFRQAAASRIVTAAHQIICGDVPRFDNRETDDCFFLSEQDPQKVLTTVVDLVSRRLPLRYGLDPVNDIQVLTPMHKGVLGTQNLNAALQSALNLQTTGLTRGDVVYRLGDKVMQIRNNYDLAVFNGDIGRIVELIDDDAIVVDFGDRSIRYEARDVDELAPAYCVSIHKSQGCEFKAVVMPITTQHFIMLQRNLIYTAITRARKLCVMVGTPQALSIAVKNNTVVHRFSRLSQRLQFEKVS